MKRLPLTVAILTLLLASCQAKTQKQLNEEFFFWDTAYAFCIQYRSSLRLSHYGDFDDINRKSFRLMDELKEAATTPKLKREADYLTGKKHITEDTDCEYLAKQRDRSVR